MIRTVALTMVVASFALCIACSDDPVASCNFTDELSICTDFLGEYTKDTAQAQCGSAGSFTQDPCSAKHVVAVCDADEGPAHKRYHYYDNGQEPYTAQSAAAHCTGVRGKLDYPGV